MSRWEKGESCAVSLSITPTLNFSKIPERTGK